MKGSSKIAPYVFIGPTLLLLSIFSLLPIAVALYISLTDMDLAGLANYANISFVGFKNYMDVLGDPVFLVALRNTVVYVVVGVPLIIMFSLGVALLINYGRSRLFKTFRVVYYLPSVTNIVAVAVVWSYLYNPGIGLFNYVLTTLGFDRVPWLTDPTIAKFSLILMALWRGIGLNMIIFIAALQGIDRSYYEAAAIDGASAWQRLTRITLPLMRFAIFFVSITTMIGWLQFFEEPLVMTEGGPLNGTVSAALFIYENGFQYSHFGYAAAGSFILFFIIIAVTLLQLRLQRKQNEE